MSYLSVIPVSEIQPKKAVIPLKTSNGKTLDLPYRSATGGIDYATFQSVYLPSLTNDKIIQLFKTKYPNVEQLIAR